MTKKSSWCSAFTQWLPLAVGIIVITGFAYVAVQQSYRMSANDPQIQVAEDIAVALSLGNTPPDSVVPANPTQDIGASLTTMAVVFDDAGKALGSSVALDGKLPTIPSGVFDYVKKHGEDRFTWQPKPGVRIAAVVTRYSGQVSGYVLVGRSLKEIEKREKQLSIMAGIAALAALVLTFLVSLLLVKIAEKKNPAEASGANHEAHHHIHHS